jgi:hypothetical protein
MNKSELLIGKTYKSIKFNCPVTLVPEDIIELGNRAEGADIETYIIDMFEPILLTKEWLLKLGFTKESEISEYFDGDYRYACEYVLDYKNDVLVFNNNMGSIYNHVKYVHQLQNLYFALTGEELEYEKREN